MPVAIVNRSFPGERHCGDQAGYWRNGNLMTLCIVDGLGHGQDAEAAAKAAIEYVAGHLSESLPALFAGCNAALRNSRGVAMGLAVIDEIAGTLAYAGIGNTRAIIVAGAAASVLGNQTIIEKAAHLSSCPGIVGGGYRKLTPETRPFKPGDRLFLFTDGLLEKTNISGYPADLWGDGQRLAEKLIVDWGRESDDAAMLIYSTADS